MRICELSFGPSGSVPSSASNYIVFQGIGDSLVWIGELVNYNYCDSNLDNDRLSFCMYQMFDMLRKPGKLKTFGYVSHHF
jgi:hypothetical protein